MSNTLAIAAVTATLRNLLLAQVPLIDDELSDLEVTTQPLDLARKTVTKAQLNLFLYQTAVAAAWRNQDAPGRVRPGETGVPALPLNLYYLVTAYGRAESDNDALSHRVLGCAMSVLHDHPLLDAAEIAAALPGADLDRQSERIRIAPQPFGVDELSKLWMVVQAPYRISAAYEVGVALIDSRRATRAPLPVLRRGAQDRGPVAIASLSPVIARLTPPRFQSATRLGEDIVLAGDNLSVIDTKAMFASALLVEDIALDPRATATPGEVAVHIDDLADDPGVLARWHPGYYAVALTQTRPDLPPISSNAQAFALAPRITVAPLAAAPGTIALTLTCEPRIRAGQRVVILFGDRQLAPDAVTSPADTTQPTSVAATVPAVTVPGSYVVRLRVDGVDSIPALVTGTPPLAAFDPAQTVEVA